MTITQARSLTRALQKEFGGKAEFEAIEDRPGRYRFAVTSERFEKMKPMKRQDEAWKVVDEVLDRDQTLDVSLILTYAPSDLVAAK